MLDSIVTNSTRNGNISDYISSLCSGSRQINIAVAFALESGVSRFINIVKKRNIKPNTITAIIGTSFNITEPTALRLLMKHNITLRRYRGNHIYHPKVYCFKHKDYCDVLIGSANLSKAAFTTSVEVMIHHKVVSESDMMKDMDRLFRDLIRRSVPVTKEFVDKYESKWKPRSYGEGSTNSTVTSHLWARDIFSPSPHRMVFKNKNFVFTGKFRYGTQEACIKAIRARRGICNRNYVTSETDVLVVGALGSPTYFWKKYGTKIQKARRYSRKTGRALIIPEDRWERSL